MRGIKVEITEELEQRVVKSYLNGSNIITIGVMFETNGEVVRRILAKHNIPLRKQGHSWRNWSMVGNPVPYRKKGEGQYSK